MDLKFYEKIVNNNPKIVKIEFCGAGEPTLNPDLSKMIKIAADRGILTEVVTNGILLDKEKCRELITSGLNAIYFSFEGVDKNTYEDLRVGSTHELIIENIKNFINTSKELNIKTTTGIECIDLGYTKDQKSDFRKKAKSWGVKGVKYIPMHNWYNMPVNGVKEVNKNMFFGCFLPWFMAYIAWEGSIFVCCDDFNGANSIGRLSDENRMSIKKVWNGDVAVKLRKSLKNRKSTEKTICGQCERIRRNPVFYPFIVDIVRELKTLIPDLSKRK